MKAQFNEKTTRPWESRLQTQMCCFKISFSACRLGVVQSIYETVSITTNEIVNNLRKMLSIIYNPYQKV